MYSYTLLEFTSASSDSDTLPLKEARYPSRQTCSRPLREARLHMVVSKVAFRSSVCSCFVACNTLSLSLGSCTHAYCHFHYLARPLSTPMNTTDFTIELKPPDPGTYSLTRHYYSVTDALLLQARSAKPSKVDLHPLEVSVVLSRSPTPREGDGIVGIYTGRN